MRSREGRKGKKGGIKKGREEERGGRVRDREGSGEGEREERGEGRHT